LAGRLLGRADEMSRLLDDMAVDGSRIRRELGWAPPFSLDEGLARSCAGTPGAGQP
jgi:UDP-glucose 4-epimerase